MAIGIITYRSAFESLSSWKTPKANRDRLDRHRTEVPVTKRFVFIPALALLFLAPITAAGQDSIGVISGSIRNENRVPVPGIKVDLIQKDSVEHGISDSYGDFAFYFVNPGNIEIRFEYGSQYANGIYRAMFSPGQTLQLNVTVFEQGEARKPKARWKFKAPAVAPNVWEAEKVLTGEWVDSFPNTMNLWAFLDHTEPTIVADRYDVAGMHGNRQPLIGMRGNSYTQNQYAIGGISVTAPSGNGALGFPDFSTIDTIEYTAGNVSGQHIGTGAHLSMKPKAGTREIHGQSQIFLQSGALQNTNTTERLRFFGITDSDERWRHAVDANFQIGGPLASLPWTYFGSVSVRDHEKRIREHPLPVSSSVIQETLHFNGELRAADQFSVYWAGQQIGEPQANASPQVTRDASLDQTRKYHTLSAGWVRRLSAGSLANAHFGIVSGDIDAAPQSGILKQNRQELFPGFALYGVPDQISVQEMVDRLYNTVSGAPPLITDSDTLVSEGSFGYSTIREGFAGSNHQISAGMSFRRSSITQNHRAIDNVNLLFFETVPESVRILNTPAQTRDRIHQLELYAADAISFSKLSLNFGAHASFSNGANLLDSGGKENSLSWSNLSWRAGLAYGVWNRHPLVFRAGYAHVYHQPLTTTWSAVHPAGLGFERYSWTDINEDLQYQPGEESGILKVYGAPYTRLDPDLKNPYINEVTVGFSGEFIPGITFHAFGFHRNERNLLSLVNEGVPFSSYTPVEVWDPGPDGHLNFGGDDRMVTAYAQDPLTLGQDRFVLSNPAGLKSFSQGFRLRLLLAVGGFQMEASAMRYRAVASTAPGMLAVENDTSALLGIFDDPNKAILAEGSTYFDRGTVGHFHATHDLGWGLQWSIVVSYLDGLPYGRSLPVEGFSQGIFGILVRQRGPGRAGSKGGFRTVHYRNIDFRFTKEFPLGPGRMGAVFDIFNVENRAEALLQTDVTAPTHLYRIPLRFQTPRSLQLGLRYRW